MTTIFRYISLYCYFIRFALSQAMMWRFDFWTRILMDTAYYCVSLAFFKIIFLQTTLLGGWSEPQVMVFATASLVLDAIQMTMISSSLWALPSTINTGEMDHYLLKPVNTLFVVSFMDFAANSLINLLFAGGLFAWALSQYPEPFSPGRLLLFLVLLGNGFFLYYLVRLLATIPVFWLQSPWGLERVFYSLLPFMERPDGIYRGPIKIIVFWMIPFGLMVSVPARVFFEGPTWPIMLNVTAVTAGFYLFVTWLWRKGLRAYSSASS